MRYDIYLVTSQIDGESPLHIHAGGLLSDMPNPQLEAKILATINTALDTAANDPVANAIANGAPPEMFPGRKTGRPSREVIIRGLENPELSPAGVRVGDIFKSSMSLSALLGYEHNAVLHAFFLAKRKRDVALNNETDPDERMKIEGDILEPKLRGVTFCYVDDLAPAEV